VLHKIARFNKAAPPTLTLEMFAAIDRDEPGTTAPKNVLGGFAKEIRRLKGIFTNKLTAFIFVLLAIAYMVSPVTDTGEPG
jgi:hypothetical protein